MRKELSAKSMGDAAAARAAAAAAIINEEFETEIRTRELDLACEYPVPSFPRALPSTCPRLPATP